MSPKAKTGLLAFGISGGAFLALGVIVAAVIIPKGSGATVLSAAHPESGPTGPSATASDADVRNHVWWERRLTHAEVEKLIAFLMATNANDTVLVNRSLTRLRKSTDELEPAMGGGYLVTKRWADVEASPHLWIECRGSKRPDRQDAIKMLKLALDRAEYRFGRGR